MLFKRHKTLLTDIYQLIFWPFQIFYSKYKFSTQLIYCNRRQTDVYNRHGVGIYGKRWTLDMMKRGMLHHTTSLVDIFLFFFLMLQFVSVILFTQNAFLPVFISRNNSFFVLQNRINQ